MVSTAQRNRPEMVPSPQGGTRTALSTRLRLGIGRDAPSARREDGKLWSKVRDGDIRDATGPLCQPQVPDRTSPTNTKVVNCLPNIRPIVLPLCEKDGVRGVRISESRRDVVQKASRHRWSGQGGGRFCSSRSTCDGVQCPYPDATLFQVNDNLSSPILT